MSARRRAPLVPAALLAAAAWALAGCGGGAAGAPHAVTGATPSATAAGSTATAGSSGTAEPTASASPGTTTTVRSMTSFRSPSGNIGCSLAPVAGGGTYARCDLEQVSWSEPEPEGGCAGRWGGDGKGGVVGLGSGPAAVLCVTDTLLDPEAPELAYGDAVRMGDVVCSSSKSGVRCDDTASGHGFTVARAVHDLR